MVSANRIWPRVDYSAMLTELQRTDAADTQVIRNGIKAWIPFWNAGPETAALSAADLLRPANDDDRR